MFKNHKTTSNRFFALLAAMLLGVMLSGCSSSGSDEDPEPEPLPDQQASGLYKDGTAQLDGGALMLDDLRGFVHNDRIMMFSIAGHVLYDGQINSLLSDDYEATVDVYENGVITQSDVAVTGTVLTESKITGTISGTGKAKGDFTLTFDSLYNRGATFARLETSGFDKWSNAPSYSVDNTLIQFAIDNLGMYGAVNTQNPSCQYPDGVATIPSNEINLYLMANNVIEGSECAIIGTGYTGFSAIIDGSSVDNTILYAVTNGTNSVFAVLTK